MILVVVVVRWATAIRQLTEMINTKAKYLFMNSFLRALRSYLLPRHSGRRTVSSNSLTISGSVTDCPVVRFSSLRIAVTTFSEHKTFANDFGDVARFACH